MKALSFAIILSCLCATAHASEVVRQIQWEDAKKNGEVRNGEVIPDVNGEMARLAIENSTAASKTVPLWSTSGPHISELTYAVRGKVKYEITDGEAYIELLSYFDGAGPYFSRTLGPVGQSRGMTGTSDWREYVLPFYVNDGAKRYPTRLDLNVYFPGRGKVWLGPVELVQYKGGEYPKISSAWWSDQQAGLYGGIGGSLLGCFGAAIGILAALGRGRLAVALLVKLLLVIGVTSLIAGIVALAMSQPYGVYYPLLLMGVICTALPLIQFQTIRKRYEALELRKMQASDIS